MKDEDREGRLYDRLDAAVDGIARQIEQIGEMLNQIRRELDAAAGRDLRDRPKNGAHE